MRRKVHRSMYLLSRNAVTSPPHSRTLSPYLAQSMKQGPPHTLPRPVPIPHPELKHLPPLSPSPARVEPSPASRSTFPTLKAPHQRTSSRAPPAATPSPPLKPPHQRASSRALPVATTSSHRRRPLPLPPQAPNGPA
eukprot:359517-Chlamydomonas_euryale.AAC.6